MDIEFLECDYEVVELDALGCPGGDDESEADSRGEAEFLHWFSAASRGECATVGA